MRRSSVSALMRELNARRTLPRGDGGAGSRVPSRTPQVPYQSAIRTRVASNAIPGACRDVPRHDATRPEDFP